MVHGRCLPGLLFTLMGLCLSAQLSWAAPVGMYGVTEDHPGLSQNGVDAVFLPPQAELIASQVAAGRQVFLSLNVFGGTQPWKEFPDAVPVMSDGQRLSGEYGGICPTHPQWRASRLRLLAGWLHEFAGEHGVSGVWLDFIRYPGRWEREQPHVPDTCYCDRCLRLFQLDRAVAIPLELTTTRAAADWIKLHAASQWLDWKKEQISSFVRDARKVLDENAPGKKLTLGVFLVPWRKSDFNGALPFQLAQDAEQFRPYVDIFSPMVYHRMVGRPVAWIGEITDYFAEMTDAGIWPIIQAKGVSADEFGRVVQTVSQAKAAGLLVYTYKDMAKEQWPLLGKFEVAPNLLHDPRLETGDGTVELSAGNDGQAVWQTGLPACRPGSSYLFSAEFFRRDLKDGRAYPVVSLWGQEYLLNTHRMAGRFQKLQRIVGCPEGNAGKEDVFEFRNEFPGNSFRMRSPELVERQATENKALSPPDSSFFPIGTYGAKAENLGEIKKIGLNTAVLGLTRENVEACLALDMHCTLAVPREPENLIQALNTLEPLLRQGRFAYYVNDEPGIHSFPQWKAEDIERIIKSRFAEAVTNMAIVRPQVIPFYRKSADYFMLDQYPVPGMPITWLSDSMDEAALHVGRGRLQSVIQAFGDEQYAKHGWPRLPTFSEMNCLAYLSVIHGSRGIYFYTFPAITATAQGKEDFVHLVSRLNKIRSWLQVPNDEKPILLRMTSPNRFDPKGNPAVHCSRKEQDDSQLLICVNTINTSTTADIDVPQNRQTTWQDYYTGQVYHPANGTLRTAFAPLEVKTLVGSDRYP